MPTIRKRGGNAKRSKLMQEVVVKGLQNGALEIALSGDIDLGNAEEFYNVVAQAYAEAPANIHFDCANLNFIDSTTLGTFVYDRCTDHAAVLPGRL